MTNCARSCCKTARAKLVLTLVAIVVSVASLLTSGLAPPSLNAQVEPTIDAMVRIDSDAKTQSSDLYKAWVNGQDVNAPVILSSVYLWGVTNVAQVLAGQKPVMQQYGPYVTRKIDNKRNVQFSRGTDGLALVTYETQSTWTPASLGQSESDTITTWNPLFMALRDGPLSGAYVSNPQVYNWTDAARLFTTRTAGELLRGFSDPVLSYLRTLVPVLPPQWPGPWTNASGWTRVTQYVGEPDRDPWNRRSRVPRPIFDTHLDGSVTARWGSSYSLANILGGTDGMMFARPLLSSSSTADTAPLHVWSDEVGRILPLLKTADVGLDGVRLLRFTTDPRWLLSAADAVENTDFNQFGPNGLANLTAMLGAEVFVSKPHFLDGDSSLVAGVDGVGPDRSLHDIFLDVAPHSGATLRAQKALQVVYCLRPMNRTSTSEEIWFSSMTSPSRRYVPAYWIAETAVAGPDVTGKLKAGFANIALIATVGSVFTAIGVTSAVAAMGLLGLLFASQPPSSTSYGITRVKTTTATEAMSAGRTPATAPSSGDVHVDVPTEPNRVTEIKTKEGWLME
jgi:hypothetical protein